MDWSIIFAFAAMLSWGIGDFVIQKSTRKIGDLQTLFFIGIVGSIGLFPFVLKDLSAVSLADITLLGVLGIITFIAGILNFEALKQGKLSIVEVVLEIELPITIVLSVVFFKEMLSATQMIIIGFIFIGIILIATKSFHHWKSLEKGVLWAVAATLFMGTVNFLTAAGSKATSPMLAIWGSWLIFTLICIVAVIKRKEIPSVLNNIKKFTWLIVIMGIIDTLAWVFFAFSVFKNEVAITTAITESYPAIALFLGLWINKERINWHQYLGAFLALACSVLLSLTI
ncbi:DMT family transporter [Candidatus Woesearchaeota archaeon]|nr:MAG: DMT family transporter [Candidatus Woesearchaeota archaeon]